MNTVPCHSCKSTADVFWRERFSHDGDIDKEWVCSCDTCDDCWGESEKIQAIKEWVATARIAMPIVILEEIKL